MAQAVWSGFITFGLVSIPVKLYPAAVPKDVRFHLVDPETGRRVRYRRVTSQPDEGWAPLPAVEAPAEAGAPADVAAAPTAPSDIAPAPAGPSEPREVDVPWRDLARGYETEEGETVVLTTEEIAELRPTRSRSIEIEVFVDLADIDPVYFEKSYYVAPERRTGAEKSYALLLRAMERAGKVAIGRFVLRTKPHLVAIRPMRGLLALETLYFGDEVRPMDELSWGIGEQEVSEREVDTAEQLIGVMASAWDPSRYADSYREAMLRLIREKTPVQAEVARLEEHVPARASELMEALKASVEAARKERHQPAKPKRPKRAG